MAQAKWSTISFEKQVGRIGSVCNFDCDSAFYSEELNVHKVKKEVKYVLTVMLTKCYRCVSPSTTQENGKLNTLGNYLNWKKLIGRPEEVMNIQSTFTPSRSLLKGFLPCDTMAI